MIKLLRCRDGKENWDGGYLYYPFLHSTVYRVLATHNYNISQWWDAGMGNTDTLHPNSCLCSFSIPTSKRIFLEFVGACARNHTHIRLSHTHIVVEEGLAVLVPFLPSPEVLNSCWYLGVFFFCLFSSRGKLTRARVSNCQLTTALVRGVPSSCFLLQSPRLEKHFGVSFVLIRFVISELSEVWHSFLSISSFILEVLSKYHKYCSNCLIGIPSESSTNCCPNSSCNKSLSEYGAISYFVEIPISKQIRSLFSKHGFYDKLQHRFTRSKYNESHIEDIYDGKLYQEHFHNGFLSDPHNISLLWNTDGVQVFKSSKYAIWPFFLRINELPPHMRSMKENSLLAGIWFGVSKPNMLSYLKPIATSLVSLYNNGVEVHSPDKDCSFTCKCILLCGTCDLPAKALAVNMNQYNGAFGRLKCLQKGERLKVGRSTVQTYPYIPNDPSGPSRAFTSDARKAYETGNAVNGVKGPSYFSLVPCYDIIRGTSVALCTTRSVSNANVPLVRLKTP